MAIDPSIPTDGAETSRQDALRLLPSIDKVIQLPSVQALVTEFGAQRVTNWARHSIGHLRREIQTGSQIANRDSLLDRAAGLIAERATRQPLERLGPVINATGVVLHTNLGRAPLAERAIEAVRQAALYGNLEIDLETGKRRYRGYQLDPLWKELTGAEASLVVNNCASATVLTLNALARAREVIVSRGQLIEIGGSYRLPDVFRISGAVLHEVGTTNRTHLADYESAINPDTAALLRVHESNFRVVGFSKSVPMRDLAQLAHSRGLLAIDDIGSGCLLDLQAYGLPAEPTIGESLASAADAVLFSGDKLFGGPQCGIILGTQEVIKTIRDNPLARAARIDKLTLAALQATLEIHLAGRSLQDIPVLRQLTTSLDELKVRVDRLVGQAVSSGLKGLEARQAASAVGGGSLPTASLPTWTLAVSRPGFTPDRLLRELRVRPPHVVARIEDDTVLLDLRTILPDQEPLVLQALTAL